MTTRIPIKTNPGEKNGKSNEIQPFEWLTSPESIGGFVREHVLGNREPLGKNEEPSLRALHIGCGSSTIGEYLVRAMGFENVVNVDRDRATLEAMEQRWRELNCFDESESLGQAQRIRTPSTNNSVASTVDNNMEFWCLDYTSETLPTEYEGVFDLVVDKSTLDCTLCSDCSSTASFLMEIYRTLNAKGGVYLIISFHELDLILPLIKDLPGAKWTVHHTQMDRTVESVADNAKGYSNCGNTKEVNPEENWRKEPLGEVDPLIIKDDHRKPLNVLIARRMRDSSNMVLNFHDVVRHVQEVNDRWFQEEQPLLTKERIRDLEHAFKTFDDETSDEKKMNSDAEADSVTSNPSIALSLDAAYEIMFTAAEREHLTYEHFLEDWEAFCSEEGDFCQNATGQYDGFTKVTFELALKFLEVNQ